MYDLPQPVYTDVVSLAREAPVDADPSFTLHVDIDGTDPLGVVSGEVAGGPGTVPAPAHFIGRVTRNDSGGVGRALVVESFRFRWPDSGDVVDRLEISISPGAGRPSADVTFVASGGRRYGPFTVTQESTFFRELEVEVDVEQGAVPVEAYATTTHPVRPPGLPAETLTLESAYAKAGIMIRRSPDGSVIDTAAAAGDSRWSSQELHDAMASHWASFANRPQWKMWIFLAGLADDDGLGGIMFDADIQEPGGVDRQGTAIFTLSPTSTPQTAPTPRPTRRRSWPPSGSCSSTSSTRPATPSTWLTRSRRARARPGRPLPGCRWLPLPRRCRG